MLVPAHRCGVELGYLGTCEMGASQLCLLLFLSVQSWLVRHMGKCRASSVSEVLPLDGSNQRKGNKDRTYNTEIRIRGKTIRSV